ncbi:MAG: hypothetical protein ACHQ1H_00725 [Nitrososphaerales archaeon]
MALNNSQDHIESMMSSKGSYNEHVWNRINALLESSVNLDQISILESEIFSQSEKLTSGVSALLHKVEGYAAANAKRIQEARKLILSMR